ncbi:hypothetical protein GCM10008910_45460 [Faecalicatena orotica]|uniref:Uncharacterized protein n=1 Tax=Faecalicatena orotica TaxID=1544 RepID=A0A2Y9BGJ8_9FIRM|nr:hypothetical protein [Faecalicatena orotica]PWJ29511.1 hypothetical protein A8806_106250 [Faecalicatena orotica]SSA55966.1 hypothetical protein SAMN05216536_106250 [Faecalicatena orotica]
MIKITASADTEEELIQFIDNAYKMAADSGKKIYNIKRPKQKNGKFFKGYFQVGYLCQNSIDGE